MEPHDQLVMSRLPRRSALALCALLGAPLAAQTAERAVFAEPMPPAAPVSGEPQPEPVAAVAARAVLALRAGRPEVVRAAVEGRGEASLAAWAPLAAALEAVLGDLRERIAAGERFKVIAPIDADGTLRQCTVVGVVGDPPALALERRDFAATVPFAAHSAWSFALAADAAGLGRDLDVATRRALLDVLVAVDRLDADDATRREIDRRMRRVELTGIDSRVAALAATVAWVRALRAAENAVQREPIEAVCAALDAALAKLPADADGRAAVAAAIPSLLERGLRSPVAALGGLAAKVTPLDGGRFRFVWDFRDAAQAGDWLPIPAVGAEPSRVVVDADQGTLRIEGRSPVRAAVQIAGPVALTVRLPIARSVDPAGGPIVETGYYGRWWLGLGPDGRGLGWQPLIADRHLAVEPDGAVFAIPAEHRDRVEQRMLIADVPFRLGWTATAATLAVGDLSYLTAACGPPLAGAVALEQPFVDRDHAVVGPVTLEGVPLDASIDAARDRVRVRLQQRMARWMGAMQRDR